MDYLTYKRRMCRRRSWLFRVFEFVTNLPYRAVFRKPRREICVLPEGWKIDHEAGRERLYEQADRYREHLLRLATIQPVHAIPNDVGRILYDDLQMIDRYDGLLFLTKLGVMYLKNRGLV